MNSKTRLTIFTPTFNRKKELEKAYQALCNQTNQEFIWLVVDDGSTDGTRDYIAKCIQEERIQITYEYQPNAGKMRAHNRGVSLCQTLLFTCIDSDDHLSEHAVEDILTIYHEVFCLEQAQGLAGIIAYRGKSDTQTMFGESFIIADTQRIKEYRMDTLSGQYRKGFKGETTLVFLTEILRKHMFPEFEGEKFVPEAVIYDQIDSNYQMLLLPKVLTICAYQEDGLTRSIQTLRKQNPKGWYCYYQARIEGFSFYRKRDRILFWKYIAHGVNFAKRAGCPAKEYKSWKNVSFLDLLVGRVLAFGLRIVKK